MEDVGIFYGRLVYFMAIWYILWPFGIFKIFGMLFQLKSGNPGPVSYESVIHELKDIQFHEDFHKH
jgi:hypothetical protein